MKYNIVLKKLFYTLFDILFLQIHFKKSQKEKKKSLKKKYLIKYMQISNKETSNHDLKMFNKILKVSQKDM